MMERITEFTSEYLSAFRVPHVGILDVLEILILTFLIYQVMIMIKNARAWTFLKGIAVVVIFLGVAVVLNMSTIIWVAEKMLTLVAIAVIVALQPEIRRMIEQIGQKNILAELLSFDYKERQGRFSDQTLEELMKNIDEESETLEGFQKAVEEAQAEINKLTEELDRERRAAERCNYPINNEHDKSVFGRTKGYEDICQCHYRQTYLHGCGKAVPSCVVSENRQESDSRDGGYGRYYRYLGH